MMGVQKSMTFPLAALVVPTIDLNFVNRLSSTGMPRLATGTSPYAYPPPLPDVGRSGMDADGRKGRRRMEDTVGRVSGVSEANGAKAEETEKRSEHAGNLTVLAKAECVDRGKAV